MLSTKSVLPNFIKTLLAASMIFSGTTTFANELVQHEKLGDLKDMSNTPAEQIEPLKRDIEVNDLKSSLNDTSETSNKSRAEELLEKARKLKANE